jgi:enediyne biosynthesis protein CalE5
MSRVDTNGGGDGPGSDWNSAAAGWGRWVEVFEKGGRKLSDRMVEIGGIEPGQRVMDIATGPGDPGLVAARRVGQEGHVTLTDVSTEMLDIARARAQKAGLENVSFQQSDAASLAVGGDPFDAVISRWGFMLFDDRPAAVRAAKSHLKSGGRFVAAVWGPPASAPLLSTAPRVVMEALGIAPPPPGTPGIFGLADPSPFLNDLAAEGFSDIEVEECQLVFPFESASVYVRFIRDIAAPINAMLARETPERQLEIWDMVERAVAELAGASGTLAASDMSLVVSATA